MPTSSRVTKSYNHQLYIYCSIFSIFNRDLFVHLHVHHHVISILSGVQCVGELLWGVWCQIIFSVKSSLIETPTPQLQIWISWTHGITVEFQLCPWTHIWLFGSLPAVGFNQVYIYQMFYIIKVKSVPSAVTNDINNLLHSSFVMHFQPCTASSFSCFCFGGFLPSVSSSGAEMHVQTS